MSVKKTGAELSNHQTGRWTDLTKKKTPLRRFFVYFGIMRSTLMFAKLWLPKLFTSQLAFLSHSISGSRITVAPATEAFCKYCSLR